MPKLDDNSFSSFDVGLLQESAERVNQPAAADLPPFYYLDNFDALTASIKARYSDLLTADERRLLDQLTGLEQQQRALFVRMHGRKGSVFRLDKLVYAELVDIPQLAEQLDASGMIELREPVSEELQHWLPLFSKPEILQWLMQKSIELPKGIRQWKRAQLDEWLLTNLVNCADLVGPDESLLYLQPDVEALLALCQLLYFGNSRQSLTDFVLRDLGVYRYPEVPLDGAAKAFVSRHQLDQHVRYYDVLPEDSELLKSMSAGQLIDLAAAYPYDEADSVLCRRVERQWLRIARQLERLGDLDAALEWYRKVDRAPSAERQIRILAKTDPVAAMQLAHQSWLDPADEEESRFLESFIPRLNKQLAGKNTDLPTWFEPLPVWHESKSLLTSEALAMLNIGHSIEFVALQTLLQQRGGQGFYVENALVSSVFGLLFWDVIYAPVAGAFYHPFQLRPDDLYEDSFLDHRPQPYQQTLAIFESGQWQQRCLDNFQRYKGTANPFVYWGFIEAAVENGCLTLAFERISDAHWQAIFERMFGDLKRRKTGLPDLIWFDDSDGFELIEIKGPGDTLQGNQKSWLGFFEQQGIPAKVWYLTRPTGEDA